MTKPAPAGVPQTAWVTPVEDEAWMLVGGAGSAPSPPSRPAAAAQPAMKAPPKAQPKAVKTPSPPVKALNPLPQKGVKAPSAAVQQSSYAFNNSNAASSAKWAERPVERLTEVTYEEEEDPELAKYIWDRKAQRPKNATGRPVSKAVPQAPPQMGVLAGPPPRAAAPPNAQRQRQLLVQVMEMGFDEPSAKRALMSTGWAVEAAVSHLLGA